MDKLPNCPFCGAPDPFMREKYVNGTANKKHYRRECRVCHASFANWFKRASKADEAWNRRAEPENKALTLEELQERDGVPVWISDIETPENSCWRLIYWDRGKYLVLHAVHLVGYLLDEYGETWLAYDHPPKEAAQ